MHNRTLRPVDRLEGPPDQRLASLHQHLDRHVFWDAIFLNQAAQEIELRIRSRWETHLNLLEADTD
jgi:hypothetical protein